MFFNFCSSNIFFQNPVSGLVFSLNAGSRSGINESGSETLVPGTLRKNIQNLAAAYYEIIIPDPQHCWHTHTHNKLLGEFHTTYCRESDKYPVFQFSQKALNRLPFRLAFGLHGGGGGRMSEVGRGFTVPPLTRLAESTQRKKTRR